LRSASHQESEEESRGQNEFIHEKLRGAEVRDS
jgi:hypothetical protein